MNRRLFLAAIGAICVPCHVHGQPRMRRVALVTIADLKRQPLASLVDGLRQLGYEEGRNLELLPSMAEGTYGKLAAAAKAAVDRHPDVIVTDGSTATRAVKAATQTIPVVMVVGSDPVEHGFVRQLARPEATLQALHTTGRPLLQRESSSPRKSSRACGALESSGVARARPRRPR
jgi:putative tryptophan/tyrosine transport system substrate-binding protein